MTGLASGDTERAFWRLFNRITDDCVIWPHGRTKQGYGKAVVQGQQGHVHRLALQFFTGLAPDGMEARHGKCHARACMNARGGHVIWGTTQENSLDRHRDGTCSQAKLSENQVHEIRRLADGRVITQSTIAAKYNVSISLIERIKARETWRHLPEMEDHHVR